MHIDRWLELKRTKVFSLALAALFGLEQAVWGADPGLLQSLASSAEQRRYLDDGRRAAIITMYDDLYGRLPSPKELQTQV